MSERRVEREGGKEGRGEKERQDVRLISYPCIIQKRTESLSRWWIWMRSKSYTRVPLNESSVNERKVLGGC